jgi:hypothetical protein
VSVRLDRDLSNVGVLPLPTIPEGRSITNNCCNLTVLGVPNEKLEKWVVEVGLVKVRKRCQEKVSGTVFSMRIA